MTAEAGIALLNLLVRYATALFRPGERLGQTLVLPLLPMNVLFCQDVSSSFSLLKFLMLLSG